MTTTNPTSIGPLTQSIDSRSMSYYLGLRQLPFDALEWVPGVSPTLPARRRARYSVATSGEVLDALAALTSELDAGEGRVGLLLSGGIDSAILAALVPPETPCFTIAFEAPGAVDESAIAATYAAHWGHPHHVVRISFADYRAHADHLMARKAAPLHAVEVPLYLAAHHARGAGISSLVVGNGADSTFGGMDKLLARDWTFDEFVERYTFADPTQILVTPSEIADAFEPYRQGFDIDVQAFLHECHGRGIVHAFENAIGAAGVHVHAPFEMLEHRGSLDLGRIRAGEPKYILADAYKLLYDTNDVPEKVAFARPMTSWLDGWEGPSGRRELLPDLGTRIQSFDGEAQWLIWCLDRFCSLLDILTYAHG